MQIINTCTYTLTTTIDQQTLTNMLNTPVNSQPVTPHKIPRKPADPTPNNNLCGAMAVGNLLNSLGAKADANLISQIGGLTSQGISMHGLSQAAQYYGIQLTGLKIDSGQLKPNDIVLLNINGNNHYALILGKIGDNYIIQDPFLGTVIMTTEQFNKYYTGNALTMNPDGRGTPLSIEEMKNLFGGTDVGQAAGNAFQLAESFFIGFPIKPLAIFAAVVAAGIFVGGFIYYYFIDEHVTPKGTGINGIINDIIGLPSYIAANFPNKDAYKEARKDIDLTDSTANEGTFLAGLWLRCADAAVPYNYICKGSVLLAAGGIILSVLLKSMGVKIDKFVGAVVDSVLNIPNVINGWWNNLSFNTTVSSSGSYTMNNTSFNLTFNNTTNSKWTSRLMMINVPGIMNAAGNFAGWASGKINEAKTATSGLVNGFKAAAKDAYNRVVQPALDRFNQERVEFQKKGLVKYIGDKYTQAKTFVRETAPKVVKYYNKTVKPWMEKNVKPAMHKRLDPVWNHPATQWVVKNVPGVKTITNGLGWIGNKLGIW